MIYEIQMRSGLFLRPALSALIEDLLVQLPQLVQTV